MTPSPPGASACARTASLRETRATTRAMPASPLFIAPAHMRSEEHTSELQSLRHLVCRLLLEKKKNNQKIDEEHVDTAFTDNNNKRRKDEKTETPTNTRENEKRERLRLTHAHTGDPKASHER